MQTHTKTILPSIVSLFTILLFNVSATAQEIWGMTKYGGEYDKGVIFKMDENAANQEVVFSFETIRKPEGGLVEYKDGVFYGMTKWGGKNDLGVIYRFDINKGSFIKILDFDGEDNGRDGTDRMIYASNDKMYGTTVYGGEHDKGIMFEFDPQTESFTKIIDFDGQEKGATPTGSLVEGDDGLLYGTTATGGVNDDGVLFSYDESANNYSKVFDFNSTISGASPVGSLIQMPDGILYGMTRWGGAHDDGAIFSFNPASGQFTVLFEFDGISTGSNPVAGLTATPNGKLYGLTPYGGDNDYGVLFEYDPQSGEFSKEIDFPGTGAGEYPHNNLVEANNGKLYGLVDPGLHQGDWLFEYDPENNTYRRPFMPPSFPRETEVYLKSLMLASNNKLYFTVNANQNDIRNENSLYEFDLVNEEFTNHFRFSGIETGEFPHGSLYQELNGMLYGTTYIGGAYHQGVIFKIDPETYSFTKIVDFESETMGAKPNGGVVQAENRKMYGLTSEGGIYNKGVLYELNPDTEDFIKLIDFDGNNGEHPDGDLVKAPNGKLYGVTPTGGNYGDGVLFEFDPEAGVYEKLIDFQGEQHGKEPVSNALVAASNGSVYGTTSLGGLFDKGVLFEYNPANESYTKIIEYQETGTGQVPTNFVQGHDNKLYAQVGPGTITRFDPIDQSYTNSVYDAYYLNALAGRLLPAANGKFYGMDRGLIWYRATDFFGGIHEYDVVNGTYTHIMEFSWGNGSNPENTSLIQLGNISAPLAQCKNISVYLDESGQAVLVPADVDDGSSGNGIELALSKSSFTCEDTGENTIVLTATDVTGYTASCNAVVTVADTIPPGAVCKDAVVYLDSDGNAVVAVADVDNGSNDACGLENRVLDVSAFTCSDTGENLVELSVSDSNGNVSTCTAAVTVIDSVAPAVVCRNVEVYLDSEGNGVIEAADVDNGSSDACGIDSIALSVTDFTCENLGENQVELTATDVNGNTSTCVAVVTVMDNLEPDISCMTSLALNLDPYEEKFIVLDADWDAEASDNCRIKSLEYFINGNENAAGTSLSGIDLEAGIYEILWVASDDNENNSSCITTISIEKRSTKLLISENKIDREQGEIQIEAVLFDEMLEQGIEGKIVGISINDDSASIVTDENGMVTLVVPLGDELQEVYAISAWFEEDETYTASNSESGIITEAKSVAATVVNVYPNPFIEKLYIEFVAPQSADARIDLFDSSGRLVSTVFNQHVEAARFYKAEYRPERSNSGFFLYRMIIGNAIHTGKVINGR